MNDKKSQETEINEFLRLGLKVYFIYKNKNQMEIANQVLTLTSKIAELLIAGRGIKSQPIICGCGKQLRIGREIQFYKNWGMCFDCHVQEYRANHPYGLNLEPYGN